MTKEQQIKKLVEELLPLLDLKEKNRLIGFLNGMLVTKRASKEIS